MKSKTLKILTTLVPGIGVELQCSSLAALEAAGT